MARLRGGYQGARSCTGGPQPGAWGQMDWYLTNYADDGGVNSGIYNCRSVRGGRTTSLHGEGRAGDNGVRPYSAEYGTKLANAIVNNSRELGVQCVIWNRKIWSSSYPDQWRNYTGVAHHRDHLHIEFTWASAKRDRKAQAELWARILGGGAGGGSIPTSGGSATYRDVHYGQLLKIYTKGNPVKDAQSALGLKVDGYYGPDTKKAVEKFQKDHGLTVDGIVGPKTWNALKKSKGFKSHRPATKPKPAPKSKTPPFRLKSGHWYGPESSNPRNHSGYHKGDRPGIRQLQSRLKSRGWSIGVDGRYGPQTEKIVRQFQKEKGLRVDGAVGAKTWAAIWAEPIT